MACVEEKCVVMDNTDEDPISSLTMFLKDWEVQGRLVLRGLEWPLHLSAFCAEQMEEKSQVAKTSRIIFLTLSLWSKRLHFLAW